MADSSRQHTTTIRLRTDNDLPACVSVLERVYAKDSYPIQGVENALSFLKGPCIGPAWVAERAGGIVGQASIGEPRPDSVAVSSWRQTHGKSHGIALLERLFVDPEHRGSGVAAQLINEAVRWSQNNGVRLVLLVLIKDVVALKLYKRLGWVQFATTTYHYGRDQEMEGYCLVSPARQ